MKPLLSAVLLGLTALPAQANEAWRCETPNEKITSFIGGPIVIAINAETGKSVAHSALIHALYGGPIDAEIKKNDARVLRAVWVIKDAKDKKGNFIPTIRYSAIIQKSTGAFNYYGKPINYDNRFATTGVCKRVK